MYSVQSTSTMSDPYHIWRTINPLYMTLYVTRNEINITMLHVQGHTLQQKLNYFGSHLHTCICRFGPLANTQRPKSYATTHHLCEGYRIPIRPLCNTTETQVRVQPHSN